MRYRILHTTRYSGPEPVSVGHNQTWLRPRNLPHQCCDQHMLAIHPEPSILTSRLDVFGNTVNTFSFNQGYDVLEVAAESEVQVYAPRLVPPESPAWEQLRAACRRHALPVELDALQFTFESPLVPAAPEVEAYAAESFPPGRPIAEAAGALMQRIDEDFEFDPQATTVSTPVQQVFEQRRGVCQDFAHLMLAMLRSLGLPGRYVSGYLRTHPPAGRPRLVGADASHAWVSVFCGAEAGWLDFDPTNGLVPLDEHVTVAWGRDYSDVPPLRGVFLGGGQLRLEVSVDVEPLEAPAPPNSGAGA